MGVHAERDPEVRADARHHPSPELGGRDPHDDIGSAVEADLGAHQIRIGTVACSPEVIRDDDDGMRALGGVFFGKEEPALRRPHAHHVEVVARYHLTENQFASAVHSLDTSGEDAVVRHGLEDVLRPLGDECVRAVAAEEVPPVAVERVNVDDALGFTDAPVLKQNGVHEREDRRVRSDAESH